MESKKTFGDYLKNKRIHAGLTQKEFADKLYITESAVSKWERGLSYPDITLITEICKFLNISERELLTASEDVQTRNQEKLANRYIALLKGFKVVRYVLYSLYLAAILVCFIVNLAVDHTLSWFFIVISALAVAASVTLLPALVSKRRGILTLVGFTASLLTLLAVCCIYTKGNWFFISSVSILAGLSILFVPIILKNTWLPSPICNHKTLINFIISTILLFVLLLSADIYTNGGWFLYVACPLALFFLILPWGYMLIIRYAKINSFFKTASCMALTTAVLYFQRAFVNMIIKEPINGIRLYYNFADWSLDNLNGNIDAIIFFAFLGLTIAFSVAGIIRELNKVKSENKNINS